MCHSLVLTVFYAAFNLIYLRSARAHEGTSKSLVANAAKYFNVKGTAKWKRFDWHFVHYKVDYHKKQPYPTFAANSTLMSEYSSLSKWFNSPYYLMLQESDHYEKGKFINDLVGHLKPFKESRILQSTCGTGGLSKVMVDAGFDVTAIDYSFEAINKAKQFENEKLRFFQHDVRLPFWINYFNYAFNLFTSFGYFNTLREHNNSMRTISQSLVPDGILVIDTDNVHYKEDNLQKNQKKIINDLQLSFTEWQDNEKFYKKIELEEHGSTKELYTEKFLKYSIGDFTDMLAYQGLQIQEVFGDYGFSHYNIRTSPRLILIAKKIGR